MTVVLKTTKQITFDDLSGRLELHYSITVVAGCEAEPVLIPVFSRGRVARLLGR